MEEKKTVFNHISRVFSIYGVMIAIFMIFSYAVGELTIGYASLFALGRSGLTLSTMTQLLILAIIITVAQNIFLSDAIIKNMSIIARNIGFMISVMVVIIIMIFAFSWFPVGDIRAWLGFIVCYLISMGISICLIRLKENAENRKMQNALEKYNQRP